MSDQPQRLDFAALLMNLVCHCEGGEADRGNPAEIRMDCFVAALLAMTSGGGSCHSPMQREALVDVSERPGLGRYGFGGKLVSAWSTIFCATARASAPATG